MNRAVARGEPNGALNRGVRSDHRERGGGRQDRGAHGRRRSAPRLSNTRASIVSVLGAKSRTRTRARGMIAQEVKSIHQVTRWV